MIVACEYSRLSFAPAATCETRFVTAGSNERRLLSQAIVIVIYHQFVIWYTKSQLLSTDNDRNATFVFFVGFGVGRGQTPISAIREVL